MTLFQIVNLFKTSKANVSEHNKSINKTCVLDKDTTVRKSRTIREEGKLSAGRELEILFLLDSGIGIEDIRLLTGHSSRKRTGVRYVHFPRTDLNEKVNQLIIFSQEITI